VPVHPLDARLEADERPDQEVDSLQARLVIPARSQRVQGDPDAGPGRGRFPVRAVWRASGAVNPAIDGALRALGDARR